MKCEPKTQAARETAIALSTQFLVGTDTFRIDVLRDRSWVAAPGAEWMSDEFIDRLTELARLRGESTAMGTTTEPTVQAERCELRLEGDELAAFQANCMLRSFLLVPTLESFALLFEGDYFWSLAGDRKFIEAAFEKPLEEILEDFRVHAMADHWMPEIREWLTQVWRHHFEASFGRS